MRLMSGCLLNFGAGTRNSHPSLVTVRVFAITSPWSYWSLVNNCCKHSLSLRMQKNLQLIFQTALPLNRVHKSQDSNRGSTPAAPNVRWDTNYLHCIITWLCKCLLALLPRSSHCFTFKRVHLNDLFVYVLCAWAKLFSGLLANAI